MNTPRRAFLSSVAATGLLLSGCLGGESDGGGGNGGSDSGDAASATAGSDTSPSPTPNGSATETDAETTDAGTTGASSSSTAAANFDHPSTTDLATQPALGPQPGAAPLILAFEDPSCHNCERFNTDTFPELESELIDPGEVSYVYRNFPHAYEWGQPAMGVLEATYARSETAFWALKEHYFVAQSEFDEENVLDRSRQFLASETDLDAAAVIENVQEGEFEQAVERDVSAGEAAGVVSTPTFFLFRGGAFLTEIRGAQSYDVFAQALGVG